MRPLRALGTVIDAFRPADGPPPQTLGAFIRWSLSGAWPPLMLAAVIGALAGTMEVISALLLGWTIDAALASGPERVLADHAPGLRLDVVVADPSFAQGDPHLATYVASLGARLVIAPVRMRDGTPRHDAHLLTAVYAGIMGL